MKPPKQQIIERLDALETERVALLALLRRVEAAEAGGSQCPTSMTAGTTTKPASGRS